jgi:hypothetical protein
VPLDTQALPEFIDGEETTSPQQRPKRSSTRQQQPLTLDNSDDAHLVDDETQHRYGNPSEQLTSLIALESQRQDDQFTSAIIDYLHRGKLPTDKDLVRCVLFQEAD